MDHFPANVRHRCGGCYVTTAQCLASRGLPLVGLDVLIEHVANIHQREVDTGSIPSNEQYMLGGIRALLNSSVDMCMTKYIEEGIRRTLTASGHLATDAATDPPLTMGSVMKGVPIGFSRIPASLSRDTSASSSGTIPPFGSGPGLSQNLTSGFGHVPTTTISQPPTYAAATGSQEGFGAPKMGTLPSGRSVAGLAALRVPTQAKVPAKLRQKSQIPQTKETNPAQIEVIVSKSKKDRRRVRDHGDPSYSPTPEVSAAKQRRVPAADYPGTSTTQKQGPIPDSPDSPEADEDWTNGFDQIDGQ